MKSLLTFFLAIIFTVASGQVSFTDSNDKLSGEINSAAPMAVADMNGDLLDDLVRLNQGIQIVIDYQQTNGTYLRSTFNSVSFPNSTQWSMSVADIDNNGYNDILCGGFYDGIKVYFANANGTDYTEHLLPDDDIFAQGSNIVDINNDGWLDVFVCDDDNTSRIWGNNQDQTFSSGDTWIDLTTDPISDNSGNYGSIWTDFDNDGDLDLYIAKCKQFVQDPTDPRRINALYVNDGAGNYTENAAEYGLAIGRQSWTADFGDIDNDGDLDCFITNHDQECQILENDGNGYFTDISAAAGIGNILTAIQGLFADMDNDGFLDIIVSGAVHTYFHNNGDQTFSVVDNFLTDENMHSMAIGDLNHDGFIDINGGYGQIFSNVTSREDILWLNNGNDNNFIAFNLEGDQSNKSGVGARVSIYGPWGVQVREVTAGESYGISNSLSVMFGIGSATQIDSVSIAWPSGTIDKYEAQDANQFIIAKEGSCLGAGLKVSANGPVTFCSGDSVTLTASEGFPSYSWSTGENTSSITVKATGTYQCFFHDTDCTTSSNFVSVVVDPIEVASIMQGTEAVICPNGAFTVSGTGFTDYLWSNGETTDSISVATPGIFSYVGQGLCDQFASDTITISVHELEDLETMGASILINETATITSSGIDPVWYDEPIAGNILGTGNSFVTEPLSQTTTFFVEADQIVGIDPFYIGKIDSTGVGYYSAGDLNSLFIETQEEVRLLQFTVFAESAGMRKISFYNKEIPEPIVDYDVLLAKGQNVIDLDILLPKSNSIAMFIQSGLDELWVNTNIVDFPNESDLVELSTAMFGEYPRFFNLKFIEENGTHCVTSRFPVEVKVETAAASTLESGTLSVSPNPSTGILNIRNQNSIEIKSAEVMNSIGQKVYQKNGNINQLNLKGQLSPGIYLLRINTSEGVHIEKIVLQ